MSWRDDSGGKELRAEYQASTLGPWMLHQTSAIWRCAYDIGESVYKSIIHQILNQVRTRKAPLTRRRAELSQDRRSAGLRGWQATSRSGTNTPLLGTAQRHMRKDETRRHSQPVTTTWFATSTKFDGRLDRIGNPGSMNANKRQKIGHRDSYSSLHPSQNPQQWARDSPSGTGAITSTGAKLDRRSHDFSRSRHSYTPLPKTSQRQRDYRGPYSARKRPYVGVDYDYPVRSLLRSVGDNLMFLWPSPADSKGPYTTSDVDMAEKTEIKSATEVEHVHETVNEPRFRAHRLAKVKYRHVPIQSQATTDPSQTPEDAESLLDDEEAERNDYLDRTDGAADEPDLQLLSRIRGLQIRSPSSHRPVTPRAKSPQESTLFKKARSKPPQTPTRSPLPGAWPTSDNSDDEDFSTPQSTQFYTPRNQAQKDSDSLEIGNDTDRSCRLNKFQVVDTTIRATDTHLGNDKSLSQQSIGNSFEALRLTPRTPKALAWHQHKDERVTRHRAKCAEAALARAQGEYALVPLSPAWDEKVHSAVASGTPDGKYTASDFARVVPEYTSHPNRQSKWLNDAVINDYVALVAKHGNLSDRSAQPVPSHAALSSFFFSKISASPTQAPASWTRRAKIAGSSLLQCSKIFIPINEGAHWTLCVIEPTQRCVTVYNSMGRGSNERHARVIMAWLQHHLGDAAYKDSGEWNVVKWGVSPQQNNSDDCGVFACTTARQIMLGSFETNPYECGIMGVQRKRMVAELVNGGLIKAMDS